MYTGEFRALTEEDLLAESRRRAVGEPDAGSG
jgi:hypothetical protein